MLKSACSHTCVNTPGSFRCRCPPRHILDAGGRTCRQVTTAERTVESRQNIVTSRRGSRERGHRPSGRRRPRQRSRVTGESRSNSSDRAHSNNHQVAGVDRRPSANSMPRNNVRQTPRDNSRSRGSPVNLPQGDTRSHMEIPGLSGEPPIGPIHESLRNRKTPWDYAWYDESRPPRRQQHVHVGMQSRGRMAQAPPSGHLNPANSNQAGPCRRGQGRGPGGCTDCASGSCDDVSVEAVPWQPEVGKAGEIGCDNQRHRPVGPPGEQNNTKNRRWFINKINTGNILP